jgi:signal transduction histidine kinase
LITRRLQARQPGEFTERRAVGVVRIAADMTVRDASPGYASLLSANPELMARLTGQLKLMTTGSVEAVASESSAIGPDSSPISLRWTATAVWTPGGVIDHFVAIFEDTTVRQQEQEGAARSLNVLERLNRLKTEFLTMVSHEIRTALVGIQGFSELIRDSETIDLAEIKSYATEVYNDARRLDQMLDKMLDLDRVAGSRSLMQVGQVSLNAAISELVVTARAKGQGERLITDLAPDLPMVNGDGARLGQLLSILITNALKFSTKGSEVVVSSRALPGYVQISVKDHGPGMPPEFDHELFGRYKWGAGNATTKVVGSGLGLPMAREIVDLHGGKIWFDSKVGVGTVFHFTIPTAFQSD